MGKSVSVAVCCAMFGLGFFLLGRSTDGLIAVGVTVVGTVATVWSLSRLRD